MRDDHHGHDVHTASHEGNNLGTLVLAIAVFALLAFLFFYFGLPAISRIGESGSTFTIPERIDININR